MELNRRQKRNGTPRGDRGMTLIELMIAMLVLLIGVVGCMSLVAISLGSDSRNRQQSNATSVSQMLTEKISSVRASLSPTLTVTDCVGNLFNVNTAPGGAPLVAGGTAVDFTQATVAGYYMLYSDCGTNGRQMTYDVRWNVVQTTPYVKFLIVSSKMQNAGSDVKIFSLPVTVRTLVGQGT